MRHVIIGAGPAGVIAAETIRKADPSSSITIIGAEKETPYSRMAIPYLLHGRIEEKGTNLRTSQDQFKNLDIELVQARVDKVEPDKNRLTLDNGESVDYDQLLIATGSRPYSSNLDELNSPRVMACWTLEDARKIMEYANEGDDVLLVGAGFVACIIMNALVSRGTNLTTIVRGKQMVRSMMNPTASAMVKRWCLKEGLNVLTETTIEDATCNDAGELEVTFNTGKKMNPDLIIVATGVQSNVEFLEGSGIEVDNGILID
jgi:NAD(P)H-nitrite reductase large subunit